ncbi:MAG: flagellar hook-length control protein FliK [Candidatus Dactylopiibacterium carminicum]|uniref:Flagellar hook-length control protein FliK n=1 Tax=Candidatus Dactylopiibacterium carminicum TaxID=857335 RepID=A0A272EVH4_9RHOO|nr:flagellar hook-length control protein FliK [Candidatus Dactylopiibacterium carminicum]KAF7598169.1 flagellar hook-length control protein FliK [Candidatus Dactylopiibacterium carminicum]PAS94108.1 MAG: flagellar hook-length control protein FliK [Candidatus Dactylopiibacterium carminicum]PAS96856.1 MAG: hypothetical protein BSR46_14740 [Candidatus Dactylopiibacterium carminicum]PAS98128.1 MAG: flagellar hook-length control protein FliK [Candidatus Dactylopiibacterium carminicum]
MIPFDLASRVRLLLDNTNVQQLLPSNPLPEDLPRFEAGQRIIAQIQNPLPNGTFQALVAGRLLTLALPESAKSGDTLELVVTGQRGDTVFARQQSGTANPAQPADTSGARPALSQTGQIISQLLTGRFGEPQPLPLARTPSLLPAGGTVPAGEIAQVLRQVVNQSGLFYESHLRQWTDGKLPLGSLMQEPQAQLSPQAANRSTTPQAQTPAQSNPQATPESAASSTNTTASRLNNQTNLPPVPALGENAEAESAEMATARTASTEAARAPGGARIADTLMPLVHQQLEVLSSHQMSWMGQVWPGASMQWEINHPDRDGHGAQEEEVEASHAWRSTVRLQLPHLGDVNADLVLSAQGLSLEITGTEDASVTSMRTAATALKDALEAAGITVLKLQVGNDARA